MLQTWLEILLLSSVRHQVDISVNREERCRKLGQIRRACIQTYEKSAQGRESVRLVAGFELAPPYTLQGGIGTFSKAKMTKLWTWMLNRKMLLPSLVLSSWHEIYRKKTSSKSKNQTFSLTSAIHALETGFRTEEDSVHRFEVLFFSLQARCSNNASIRCHWSYRHLVKKNSLCIGNTKKRYIMMLATLLFNSHRFSWIRR